MGRIVLAILGLITLVIAGGLFFVYLKGEDLIRKAVETEAPPVLGASVQLGKLGFSPFAGSAELGDLVIGNPEGFEADHAFSLGLIRVSLEPTSVLSDHIMINEILIDRPELIVELTQDGKTNIKKLQNNVSTFAGGSDPATTNEGSQAPDISIERFQLNEATVRLLGDKMGLGDRSLTLKPIILENIGVSEGGIAPKEAFRLVMDALGQQVQKAVVEEQGKKVLDKGIDEVLGEDTGGLEGLKDKAGDKLKDGVGSLLGKKKKDDN